MYCSPGYTLCVCIHIRFQSEGCLGAIVTSTCKLQVEVYCTVAIRERTSEDRILALGIL